MPENLNNPVQPAEPVVEDIFSAVDKNIQPAHITKPAPMDNITVMPEEAGRRMSKMSWLLIILGIIAIILLALSGYLYWRKKSSKFVNKNSSVLEDQGLVKPTNNNTNKIIININKNTNISIPVPDYIDTDHDGLPDEAEEKYETDLKKIDSDDDGLSDREEVKVYLTDPNNSDTDGDGYTDGGEVKSGYNPNGPGKLMEK